MWRLKARTVPRARLAKQDHTAIQSPGFHSLAEKTATVTLGRRKTAARRDASRVSLPGGDRLPAQAASRPPAKFRNTELNTVFMS
jgi:hypothetical protein